MKSVTIIGCGFIGRSLAKCLFKREFNVTILDRNSKPNDMHNNISWIMSELHDCKALDSAIAGSDTVFYMVSTTVPADSIKDHEQLISIDLKLISMFFDSCKRNNVNKIIFISSAAVYGDKAVFPISEDSSLEPISFYGLQKVFSENYFEYLARNSNINLQILRVSNPYGPGQNVYGRQGFIAMLIGSIMSGKNVNLFNCGKMIREFIYIDDLVDILLHISSRDDILFPILNISSGSSYSLLEVISIFEEIIGSKVKVKLLPAREGDILVSKLDTAKLKSILGEYSMVDIYSGIKQTLDFNSSKMILE